RRVPRDLETIVAKATARDPESRYATAAALAEDLRRYVDDRPIRARRLSLAERLGRGVRGDAGRGGGGAGGGGAAGPRRGWRRARADGGGLELRPAAGRGDDGGAGDGGQPRSGPGGKPAKPGRAGPDARATGAGHADLGPGRSAGPGARGPDEGGGDRPRVRR